MMRIAMAPATMRSFVGGALGTGTEARRTAGSRERRSVGASAGTLAVPVSGACGRPPNSMSSSATAIGGCGEGAPSGATRSGTDSGAKALFAGARGSEETSGGTSLPVSAPSRLREPSTPTACSSSPRLTSPNDIPPPELRETPGAVGLSRSARSDPRGDSLAASDWAGVGSEAETTGASGVSSGKSI